VADSLSSDDGTSEGSLGTPPFQAVFTGTNPRPDSWSRVTGSLNVGVLTKSKL